MKPHGLVAVDRNGEFAFTARCSCGHESAGPNLLTAEKRHDIHAQIQAARAALEGGDDA